MSQRDFAIELAEDQACFESVRTAFGVWNDVLYQLSDSAYQLRALGELRQAEAMLIDAESMARRARLHLRNMTARERAKLSPQPQQTVDDEPLRELAFGIFENPNE